MPLDALTSAAIDRIKAAVKDRDPNGYTAIKAGDVLVAGTVVKKDANGKISPVVETLLVGGRNNNPDTEIFQRTDYLLHLLEQVGS